MALIPELQEARDKIERLEAEAARLRQRFGVPVPGTVLGTVDLSGSNCDVRLWADGWGGAYLALVEMTDLGPTFTVIEAWHFDDVVAAEAQFERLRDGRPVVGGRVIDPGQCPYP